ncbi:NUDIX hydrolase [Leptolyngbya cf. ectocarpi LEGE 11479]|uniref:NUDIX hydrolase n=1 Tax=Leptolyngbya cf. ectocarpi LEGE 11479 TaxID=1828722 RepID=A0A928X3X9_LEPEC|nr:NUDIX domain-containing protein [Leptolyngbya ectocarpi]MBE9066098.1 NUDIX hydrolase [Leptolyngbya cf. ectocarpi LEGE 11479]
MAYTYDYPRPAVTVDCVVFGLDPTDCLQVLLIQRWLDPFAGQWALPGGFVRHQEGLVQAAHRELREETGIADLFLEQLQAYGQPQRDPRGHTVTVAFYALVNLWNYQVRAATDAKQARWWPMDRLPALAFDHDVIVQDAIATLRTTIRHRPIGFELLPAKFTLTQLQRLYETVLARPFDKRNFRKKLLKLDILVALDEKETNVAHRAAQLYRFDQAKYLERQQTEFNFDL